MARFETIVLDIDGTLCPEVSWYALTEGLGASIEKHEEIFETYKAAQITYEQAKSKLIKLWQATGNANRAFIEKLFESWSFFPEVEQTIKNIKIQGLGLCIITGSLDIWAKAVAKRLDITHYYANTTTVWDRQSNLIDMHYTLTQGEQKLIQFKEFCKATGTDPSKCLVVGDSDNDLELFTYTKNGVAVGRNVEKNLAQQAKYVVANFSDIRKILNRI